APGVRCPQERLALTPHRPGSGDLTENCRASGARLRAIGQKSARQRVEELQPPKSARVRLRAPHDIGSVQTYSGQRLTVREDGTIEVSAEDAEYYVRDGWTKLAEAPSVEDL